MPESPEPLTLRAIEEGLDDLERRGFTPQELQRACVLLMKRLTNQTAPAEEKEPSGEGRE